MLDLFRFIDSTWLITIGILFSQACPSTSGRTPGPPSSSGTTQRLGAAGSPSTLLAHLDTIGTISLVLFGYGWGKPVPVLPSRLRGNMRASWALVSAAGPFSNFILAILAAIPFRLGLADWTTLFTSSGLTLERVLYQFIGINLGLMVFNLIPIPPLDGSRILSWVLPVRWATELARLERFAGPGMMIVLLLLSRVGILSMVTSPILNFLIRALVVN